MDQAFYQKLEAIVERENIRQKEPMSKHTTFRIGGTADFFVMPKNREQIEAVLKLAKEENIPYLFVGNGSNLLVSDEGIRGVVIQIAGNFKQTEVHDCQIKAQAGISLAQLAKIALSHELTGFECLAGIPGTLGGAVAMNAGAYGGEIKDVLVQATVLDQEGHIVTLSKEELDLSYRSSVVTQKGYVVLEVLLELQKGKASEISAQMEELAKKRREKQPLDYPSAGSTFKRPEGYFAGKLIEDAGLRGFSVGDAQVSEKHCGFVINRQNASAKDVQTLIQQVQNEVEQKFGVRLETEVKMIGF